MRKTHGYALSGGERRRVEIARCLAIGPAFILLDEPFSGIDPIAVLELQEIIFLKSNGIGVLITDHNVRETLSVTDRAYIINDGRIFRQARRASWDATPKSGASISAKNSRWTDPGLCTRTGTRCSEGGIATLRALRFQSGLKARV